MDQLKSLDEAKSHAKTKSLDRGYKDVTLYIIYCTRTKYFYVDTNNLIRLWEQLFGYYINGIYTSEKLPHKAMQITDLNGCLIEVTDLNEAIRITAQYKEYRHKSKNFSEFDKRQKVYWVDNSFAPYFYLMVFILSSYTIHAFGWALMGGCPVGCKLSHFHSS